MPYIHSYTLLDTQQNSEKWKDIQQIYVADTNSFNSIESCNWGPHTHLNEHYNFVFPNLDAKVPPCPAVKFNLPQFQKFTAAARAKCVPLDIHWMTQRGDPLLITITDIKVQWIFDWHYFALIIEAFFNKKVSTLDGWNCRHVITANKHCYWLDYCPFNSIPLWKTMKTS